MIKKAKILAVFFVVLGLYVCRAEGVDITFTSDGVIQEPNEYDMVYILNGAIVDMSGGTVTGGVRVREQSTFNFSGGSIYGLLVDDSSTANINGGTLVGTLRVCRLSLVNIYDSEMINASHLYLDRSTLNIYGGNVSVDHPKFYVEPNNLRIFGGDVTFQYLDVFCSPEEKFFPIYGCNFYYDPNSHVFTGFLLYDGQITLNHLRLEEYECLNLVVLPPVVIKMARAIAEETEILEAIDEVLDEEWEVYDALEELLESGDYGDLNKADIVKAKQKTYSAIQHQHQSKETLEKSIEKLQDALAALGWESLADELVQQ